ncbi:HlyB/MsbA family ABC transporter [Enterovibrio norvegicus]|uniref:ABC transporter ATP-binding protein n=1 Tax=Enterovibrio norvegicus TaxID=188144 RepID=UPI00030C041E|nr:ABC transporter ATP-binding protein [Enterovibrio norvegicus]OEF63294.1 HlyB/MsbA family ABC transporter [Enterovibrio norvegicus]
MDNALFCAVRRVIAHSQCSPRLFILGICWRTIERILDILPILVCYFWFVSVLEEQTTSRPDTYSETIPVNMSEGGTYYILLLAVLFVLQFLSAWLGQKYSFLGGYQIMAGYRRKVLNQIHSLPLSVIFKYRTGKLSDLVTDDINRIENIFTHLAIELFVSSLIPIIIMSILVTLDWQLALALIAGFPLAMLVMRATRSFFIKVSQDKLETNREISGVIIEFLMGIKTLRLFNRSQAWLTKLNGLFDDITRTTMSVEAWGAGPVVLFRLLAELGFVAFLLVCAWQVRESSFDPLIALLFIFLAHRLITPLLDMAQYLNIIRYAAQSEDKTEALLHAKQLPEPILAQKPNSYSVQFKDVSFSYDGISCLENVEFTAYPGEITAIVGPSGSGKTTLMNLICRFSDPDAGVVSLGGDDIKKIGTEEVYKSVSMVFQNVQLFSSTIMDNIRIGRPDATDEEVYEACNNAYCLDFINTLPLGFDTQIGEGGSRLSGGEKQRISIARAFLKDAPILLLDEITASVDSIAQYEIQQSLKTLIVGKTVIVIAHRLSAIQGADQILVMDKGSIVQQGKHRELVGKLGLYKNLWRAQYTYLEAT